MSVKLVKSICVKGFGTGNLRTGDLSGNGTPDFLLTQNYQMNREITCLTAMDIDGNILWQYGEPGVGGAVSYSDIPVQIIDWDGDGKNEVLFVKQAIYKSAYMWQYSTGTTIFKDHITDADLRLNPDLATERASEYEGDATLIILEGATGKVKQEIAIPAPADDSFGFGYFDDSGLPGIVVKDRYWNVWGLDHEGKILWHLAEEDMLDSHVAHFPVIGDIDGDGYDEVFITNTLIDQDGTILWKIPGIPTHGDAGQVLEVEGDRRIVTAADQARLIDAKGNVLWGYDAGHEQSIIAGKFSTDPAHGPYQFIGQDIMPHISNWKDACASYNLGVRGGKRFTMYAWNGDIIWAWEEVGGGSLRTIRWTGCGDQFIHALGEADETGCKPIAILDGERNVIDTVHLVDTEGNIVEGGSVYAVDLLGDSRDELVVFNKDYLNIYINTKPYNQRRHYNFTHYNGE